MAAFQNHFWVGVNLQPSMLLADPQVNPTGLSILNLLKGSGVNITRLVVPDEPSSGLVALGRSGWQTIFGELGSEHIYSILLLDGRVTPSGAYAAAASNGVILNLNEFVANEEAMLDSIKSQNGGSFPSSLLAIDVYNEPLINDTTLVTLRQLVQQIRDYAQPLPVTIGGWHILNKNGNPLYNTPEVTAQVAPLVDLVSAHLYPESSYAGGNLTSFDPAVYEPYSVQYLRTAMAGAGDKPLFVEEFGGQNGVVIGGKTLEPGSPLHQQAVIQGVAQAILQVKSKQIVGASVWTLTPEQQFNLAPVTCDQWSLVCFSPVREMPALTALSHLFQTGGTAPPANRPRATVGAYFFDGWSGPVTTESLTQNWKGLLNGSYTDREPLTGWSLTVQDQMAEQLQLAHSFGISFFIFDWYYSPQRFDVNSSYRYVNTALGLYQSMGNRYGVNFSLLYVNWDQSWAVPNANWTAVANYWVKTYFTDPSYQRTNGKPVFVIYYLQGFLQQWGSMSQANQAIQVIRDDAKQAGLPGVYVVGGILTSASASGFVVSPPIQYAVQLNVDGFGQYNYPGAGGLVNGSVPFARLVSAGQDIWNYFAANSSLPYIPLVQDGWDPRPWNEQVFGAYGYAKALMWYLRTPAQFGNFTSAAIAWVNAHPQMAVQTGSPVVFVEAWNELGEGSYMIPTVGDGESFGEALALALGLIP